MQNSFKDIDSYRLIRSARKTVSIAVMNRGELVVRAPLKMSIQRIDAIIDSKTDWIVAKQKEMIAKSNSEDTFLENSKEKALYLGRFYDITVVENYKYAFHFDSERFFIDSEYDKYRKQLFEKWIRRKGKSYLKQRLEHFSVITGYNFAKMGLTGASKRWGSCSTSGNINFSWRLMYAPPEVIDYVVVHELAHLKEANHSSNFWALVRGILPDFKKHKSWLDKHSYLLH